MISNTLIAGELEEREAIKKQTAFLLSSKHFEGLEKIAKEYRVNRGRTPSGLWKLTSFYYKSWVNEPPVLKPQKQADAIPRISS